MQLLVKNPSAKICASDDDSDPTVTASTAVAPKASKQTTNNLHNCYRKGSGIGSGGKGGVM